MTNTTTRQQLAAEYVERTHMQDWTQNDRRAELATQLGLTNHWQSYAAYLEARTIAGMDTHSMEATADWTAVSLTGGTAHDMTDPQCRPRSVDAPVDGAAICSACVKGNREHRGHAQACRHIGQQWQHTGAVADAPAYTITCSVCATNRWVVLPAGWGH